MRMSSHGEDAGKPKPAPNKHAMLHKSDANL